MDNRSMQSLRKLIKGNDNYICSRRNPADISCQRRVETSVYGQKPYAAILTCSDSRVQPEHIFSAGIGDLVEVRTAGNVVGNFEIGSIEYAVQYLNVPIVVIMGHTHCGAVAAALNGQADGYIKDIVQEIQLGLNGATTENEAIHNNIIHSKQRILQSEIVNHLIESGNLILVCAEYDIKTGRVHFLYPCENQS